MNRKEIQKDLINEFKQINKNTFDTRQTVDKNLDKFKSYILVEVNSEIYNKISSCIYANTLDVTMYLVSKSNHSESDYLAIEEESEKIEKRLLNKFRNYNVQLNSVEINNDRDSLQYKINEYAYNITITYQKQIEND